MLPTSIAGSMRSGWPPTVSPGSTRRTSPRLKGKSRPGSTPRRWQPSRLAPLTYGAGRDGVVEQHRHVGADRAHRAGGADALGELVLARGPERRPERVGELDVVDLVVAAHDDQYETAAFGDHRERLQQRALGQPELARDLRDRGQAGGRHLLGGGERLRQLDRRGLGARDLDVGGVAGRQRDVVLARGARRHVLVGADAAHHPDVRLDPVPLEPDAVEDAVVGAAEALVVLVQAGAVAVEGVGVLHDELARAQQPGARPRLVAPLGLEVVEAEGQLAVGAHEVRRRGRSRPPRASAPAPSRRRGGPAA